MILSVSRRTDIPAFYGEWFFNRLKAGEILVRNPINPHKVTKLLVSPDNVECIVFWTKDATRFIKYIEPIQKMGYNFYFQYTITSYATDIENNVPKKEGVIESFMNLASIIGKDKVIWRYDPILLNQKYTEEYHIQWFNYLCERLQNATEKCVISFVDSYKFLKEQFAIHEIEEIAEERIYDIASELKVCADKYNIPLATCAESIDLSRLGIVHNKCIDNELIGKILGTEIKYQKDKSQRGECGCMESREVGIYASCQHKCAYCYAAKKGLIKEYDVNSPMLCDSLKGDEEITVYAKKLALHKNCQQSLF